MAIDRLRNVRAGMKVNDAWPDLYSVETSIDYLLHSDITSPMMRTSRGSAQALLSALRAVTATPYDETNELAINGFQTANFGRLLTDFETVLRAEFASADAYYVTPKRGYDTLRLVSQGEILWPPELRAKVPEAILDARESGKCIAFELGTAAGFHIIRAVETVLLRYWKAVTNNKPLPKNRNLGNYLNQMERLTVGDPKIIAVLKQIKDLHRNELFHPEATLTLQEAIELLGIAQSAVGAMLKALPLAIPGPTVPMIAPADPILALEAPSDDEPEAEPSR
ncbi:MAG: hypothetical protein WAU68_07220 [Vitreimonas sp.]